MTCRVAKRAGRPYCRGLDEPVADTVVVVLHRGARGHGAVAPFPRPLFGHSAFWSSAVTALLAATFDCCLGFPALMAKNATSAAAARNPVPHQ